MIHYKLPTFVLALFLLTTVQGSAQSGGSNTVTVVVQFTSAPATASASFADLKYDKQGVFNYELDDRSAGTRDLFAFFNGGTAPVNGVTYGGKTFTDGAGNPVRWRAAVATNARLQENNSDWVAYNNTLTWPQMADLVRANWMIENHGYYHNKTGVFSNGENTNKNLNDNTVYIRERLLEQGVHYTPRIAVVPNNDAGYVPPAQSLGYLAAVSQQSLDGFPIYPSYVDQTLSLSQLPAGFALYNRGIQDGWDAGTNAYLEGVIANNFLAGMSAANKKMWRFAGHYFSAEDFEKFTSLMDFLETAAADRVWITTLQEFLEYRETKSAVVKTENLSGSTLTITLDLSRLPDVALFRDMSLLVQSSSAISSVTVSGADANSFNPATGLINVFKKATNAQIVLPVYLQHFSAQRNNTFVDLKWTAATTAATQFAIERSTDGTNFSELGSVKGSAAAAQSYSFRDAQPATDNNSYRLRITEAGKPAYYSATVVVRFAALDKTVIFPNPVRGRLITINLSRSMNGRADLWLTNTGGAIVHQQKLQLGSQRQVKVTLPAAVPPGTYILELANGEGMKESMMIVCL